MRCASNGSGSQTISKHLYGRHEAVLLAECPDARADQEDRERNHEAGRRRHQSERHDAVVECMARRSENRERGHVRAEEREQEHEWTKRPARQEVVFSFFFAFRMTKSKV